MTGTLTAHHVLEYPGGYTRSVGPVIGRFFTGAAGRTHRRRAPRRRPRARAADRVRPDDERGDRAGRRPLADARARRPGAVVHVGRGTAAAASTRSTKPFAFALIRPDGADTALLHVVDCGSADAIAVGARVAPRWKAERTGHITDIEAWVLLTDGEEPQPAPLRVPERRRAAGHRHRLARPGSSTSSTRVKRSTALPERSGRGQDRRRPRAVERRTSTRRHAAPTRRRVSRRRSRSTCRTPA